MLPRPCLCRRHFHIAHRRTVTALFICNGIFLRNRSKFTKRGLSSSFIAKIGIIGGTGLDNPDLFENRTEKQVTTPFGEPSDSLILGQIHGVPVILLPRHGRNHDVMPGNINYRANIWALKKEGCTHIIATTATGSLREHIERGDVVVLDSFIDRTQGRIQTFYDGKNKDFSGVCHIPMGDSFCERTRQIIIRTAAEIGIHVHKVGTVVAIEGPRFSSKAESYMFRLWGGDVINMTTVPEVVLAKEAGICYSQIALVTDYDCWKQSGETVSHEAVLKAFADNVNKLKKLIVGAIDRIAKEDWEATVAAAQATAKNSVYA